MNIFYLDSDAGQCARYHNDKHVVKMILESAQLLCTAHWVSGLPFKDMYKPTHMRHPSSLWARESAAHYLWLYDLFINLQLEYTYRYGKQHASSRLNTNLLVVPFRIEPTKWLREPPQAMPEQYRQDSAVEAYRLYYREDKAPLAQWTKRHPPHWYFAV